MSSEKSSYHGKLADSDLDRLLKASNTDLLAHVEAAADLTSALIAITTHDNPAASDDGIASGMDDTPGADNTTAPRQRPISAVFGSGSRFREDPEVGTLFEPAPGAVLTAYRPSVLASIEIALRTAKRGGLLARLWHWRYETGLIAGITLAPLFISSMLGSAGLVVTAAATIAILAAIAAWPAARKRLAARIWCIITPHRIRTGCAQGQVLTPSGHLPVVLYTAPTESGERVTLWCRAGIDHQDLIAARAILTAACWARDIRITANSQRRHVIVLEVIRRLPDKAPDSDSNPDTPPWPSAPPGPTELSGPTRAVETASPVSDGSADSDWRVIQDHADDDQGDHGGK